MTDSVLGAHVMVHPVLRAVFVLPLATACAVDAPNGIVPNHPALDLVPPPAYERIDLGTLGGSFTAPRALNDSGWVVGTSELPDRQAAAFLWRDGRMRRLPDGPAAGAAIASAAPNQPFQTRYQRRPFGPPPDPPDPPPTLPRYLDATTINNHGQVAGREWRRNVIWFWNSESDAPLPLDPGRNSGYDLDIPAMNDQADVLVMVRYQLLEFEAFLLRGGVPRSLGSLEDTPVFTRTTGWAGQWVTGWSRNRAGYYHAFLWNGAVMRDLGPADPLPCAGAIEGHYCVRSMATDVNHHGVVAGFVRDVEGLPQLRRDRAVRWRGEAPEELGAYPGWHTMAHRINARGQILGSAQPPGPPPVAPVAFLWDDGAVRDVDPGGPPLPSPWGGVGSWQLSDDGTVVGGAVIGGEHRAFLWKDGHAFDLGPGQAVAINDQGDVIVSTVPYVYPCVICLPSISQQGGRGILWRRIPSQAGR